MRSRMPSRSMRKSSWSRATSSERRRPPAKPVSSRARFAQAGEVFGVGVAGGEQAADFVGCQRRGRPHGAALFPKDAFHDAGDDGIPGRPHMAGAAVLVGNGGKGDAQTAAAEGAGALG